MPHPTLSFSVRKALCVHLGEAAGNEVADILQQLADRVERVERNKVDITPIVRLASSRPPAESASAGRPGRARHVS